MIQTNGTAPDRRNAAFADWFAGRLRAKEWNKSDFARATGWERGKTGGIYPSQVSRWTLGGRNPEPEMCYLIAEALGEDPLVVLRMAGHVSAEEEPDDPVVAGLVAKLRRVVLNPDRVAMLEGTLDNWRRTDQRRLSSSMPNDADGSTRC